ncbi:diacylglycerol kinase family lipid kinase [soil metagenome]
MKKIAFIVNGKIKPRKGLIKAIQANFKGDYNLGFFITELSNGATRLTLRAIKENFTVIICVGGDGSLNEVANGIMEAKQVLSTAAFEQLRTGVLPYGSGNDFAKTIDVDFDIPLLKTWIDSDRHKELDLGLVKFTNLSGTEETRHFINIADVGLGGIVSRWVNESSKWLGAEIAYQWAIIRSLISYRHQPVKARADSLIYTGKVMNYIVANGKYFGSGLGVAPDAMPDDGIFSIVIVGEISLAFYLKSLSDIRKCKRIKHPQVFYEQAKEILVESEVPQPIDMDGEYIGNTPMKIKMVPKAIRFIC